MHSGEVHENERTLEHWEQMGDERRAMGIHGYTRGDCPAVFERLLPSGSAGKSTLGAFGRLVGERDNLQAEAGFRQIFTLRDGMNFFHACVCAL